tara:strand:- start:1184 stop:2005 length:822 start_codon:yes stop_codon:yes gene_type:complete
MKKIYFGINGQFGDMIIQEPTLRKIINDNPNTKIVMGGHKKYFEILELYKDYHKNIIDFKCWDEYTPKTGWPSENDKKYIEENNFDMMYEVAPTHKEVDWVKHRHITEEMGNMFGVSNDTCDIQLPMLEGVKKEKGSVALAPISSDFYRTLGKENLSSIVSNLSDRGYTIYHLAGPNENDIKNTIKIQTSYVECVRKMLSTDFLITVDTGMNWVASAYNHPTIGLYSIMFNPHGGTTKNWQPVNKNAIYLEARWVNEININDILKAIKKMEEI